MHPHRILLYDVYMFFKFIVRLLEGLAQEFKGGDHDAQWISQLMGNAGCHVSDSRVLFSLKELLFQADPLAHVLQADKEERIQVATCLCVPRIQACLCRARHGRQAQTKGNNGGFKESAATMGEAKLKLGLL